MDNGAINLATDNNLCSSHFQRETTLFSGGRVFVKAGIAVNGSRPYCVTAWVRGTANTQPFIGINLSDVNGTPGTEHWLIGFAGFPNGYGGTVVPVTSDSQWHWYSAPFTMDNGATFVVLKDEIFQGGQAGNADFDDLQLWSGACPNSPTGAAHQVCIAPNAICGDAGKCIQCSKADTSACKNLTPTCDFANAVCVGCRSDADCGGNTPACQPNGGCGQCAAKKVAQCKGLTPACDTLHGVCAACKSDMDCSGNSPACQAQGNCGQCSAKNASQCIGQTPVCNAVSAKCVLCLVGGDASACAQSNDGHACAADLQGGVFCGCAVDGDCGGKGSGRVCDAMAHKCMDGCSPAPNRNGCPMGKFCTSNDLGGAKSGICTNTCNFDGDCAMAMPAMPLCLVGGDGGVSACVGCRSDGDCANNMSGQVCDPMSQVCAQCALGSLGACMANGVGAACVMGRCGCASDGDCGAIDSGRVCDSKQSQCVSGCRGGGGNGCPMGMVCSSVDMTLGSCSPAPDMAVSPDMTALPDLAPQLQEDQGAGVDELGVNADLASAADLAAAPVDLERAAKIDSATVATAAGGCGCVISGRDRGGQGEALALLGIVLALVVRRRRR